MIARTVAYVSPFIPPEWIEAHGLVPLRLIPPAATTAQPQGVCPFAAAVAHWEGEASWHGRLAHEGPPDPPRAGRPCHALILTTTCDQMRRIAESISAGIPLFLMNVPATWQTPTARAMYTEELHRLGRWLVSLGGTSPDAARLTRVMRSYDAHRREAYAIPSPGTPGEGRVRALAPSPFQGEGWGEGQDPREPPAVALLGGPLRQEDYWIFACIAQSGGQVVLDATETGERTLPAPFDDNRLTANPLQELVTAYFGHIPDVFRRPDTLLHEYLARELPGRGVRGILLIRHLWCDQWHAQLGRLRESTGLPVVEIDLGEDGARERSRTRIESLLNILQ